MNKDMYAIGDTVPQTGLYVCVPCGYTQQFIAGQKFVTCEACLAGTDYGPEGWQSEHVDFWQLIG